MPVTIPAHPSAFADGRTGVTSNRLARDASLLKVGSPLPAGPAVFNLAKPASMSALTPALLEAGAQAHRGPLLACKPLPWARRADPTTRKGQDLTCPARGYHLTQWTSVGLRGRDHAVQGMFPTLDRMRRVDGMRGLLRRVVRFTAALGLAAARRGLPRAGQRAGGGACARAS